MTGLLALGCHLDVSDCTHIYHPSCQYDDASMWFNILTSCIQTLLWLNLSGRSFPFYRIVRLTSP